MSNSPMFPLYDLLPAIYRIDDEKAGSPLAAFLAVIQEQADLLKQNIDQLYADLFIETCDEWVIPYIGDLVGNPPLYEVLRTRRADVARTLYYRRRKGTLPALEELARDVTGWSVRAVPFFERLVWTQNINHRRDAGKTAAIRNLQVTDLLGGAFEQIAHSVDIHEMGQHAGWYHPKRLGFFTWRLNNYHVDAGVALREAAPNAHGFRFSPFGWDMRLFQRPADLVAGLLTEERHVRQPIRTAAFFRDPSAFYDATVTPTVHTQTGITFGTAVDLVLMDLSAFEQPAADQVGIDPLRGLISFAAGQVPAAAGVSYRGEKPQLAEQLAAPHGHMFRFPLLNVAVRHDAALVPVAAMAYMDLSAWARPAAGKVGVDLGLGRLSFAPGEEPDTGVEVRFGPGNFRTALQAGAPNQHGYVLELPENVSSLRISRDGVPVIAHQLFCMKLHSWARPPALHVSIDVESGRLSFPVGEEPTGAAIVSYDYGFPGDVGGGPYDRLAPTKPGKTINTIAARALREGKMFHHDPSDANVPDPDALDLTVGLGGFDTIDNALDAWHTAGRPNCTITVQDNRTYPEHLLLDLNDKMLVLQAGNNCRPVIRGDVVTTGGAGVATLILSGLGMDSPFRADGNLKALIISHCTVAAAATGAVIVADGAGKNGSIEIEIERSIVGGVKAPHNCVLTIADSITRGIENEGTTAIRSATVLGGATLHEVSLISQSIFTGTVNITRRQSGCVRSSYVPAGSQTPRRYNCQPDLALENIPELEQYAAAIRVAPAFTWLTPGGSGYAQLSTTCPVQISAGGEDGGEMGAFQFLEQGHREANLRMRLDEYMPFSLRAGIIYVS